MLFVGHISIAFLLTYAISKKFVLKDVSISFVMFLSTLPDIDLVFRLLGLELGHRSVTHSAIIWAIVALAFFAKYRRISVAVYSLAYLSHVVIGDLVVGPINLLYPIGNFVVSGGIRFGTISHTMTEGILFAIMAIIIIIQNLYKHNSRQHTLLFHYSTLDSLFYPVLIAEIIISPIFVLSDRFQDFSSLLSLSHVETNDIAIALLHIAMTIAIAFLWKKAKSHTQIRDVSCYRT
jgi:LexA-binding, inner membrane-associated putative hydrolase